jgi:hypothetical protein
VESVRARVLGISIVDADEGRPIDRFRKIGPRPKELQRVAIADKGPSNFNRLT